LLAADLPMPSNELFSNYQTNARYRTFVQFADILVMDDGGFLGEMWWPAGIPKRIF
jgi:hypothetical protein